MTPAVLDRPAPRVAERSGTGPAAGAEQLGGGRVTLEERLNAALHEVRTNGSTECPVCQARMTLTSAGADPGPACYGRGGERTTITDVNVVLGRYNPENFLGGRLALDREAAERAMA